MRNPVSSRSAFAAAVALAGAAVLAGLACKEKPFVMPPPEVTVTTVLQQDTPVYVEFVGETKGFEDIDIRARVTGFLAGIHFKEGSEVKRGALLYTSEYLDKVAQAKGLLASTETLLTNAQIELRRVKPLVAISALSQRDLDNAEARVGAAQGQVDAAKAHLAVQELNLSYTRMTSPIDGIIGKTKAKVGEYVGMPPNPMILNTVSNVDPILVEFFLTEADYLWAVRTYGTRMVERKTAPALELVLADGTLFPHKGTVNFADRQVDSKTGTILVQASFPNPDHVIRPGQFGRVRLVADELKGAVLVPQRAVQELQDLYQVWVVGPGNKAQVRPVKLGPKFGNLWVVEEGLKAGDQVILEGLTKVEPDLVVIPKPAGGAAAKAPATGAGG
jgi:membrane fusion protein (multidrug efflux system)